RIFVGQGVTASGQDDTVAIAPFADHSMSPEAAFVKGENDLPLARVGNCVRANSEQIAGIDRRNHAAAARDKANFAEFAEDFAGEIKLHGVTSGGWGGRGGGHGGWPGGHESLRLKRHWPWVAESLPQARAMVSNTFSCLNSGLASRRFFPGQGVSWRPSGAFN